MNLDYSLTTPEQRKEYVNNLLKDYSPTTSELSLLGDYLLFTRDKNQTKKERQKDYPITTPNREQTIDKRQISYFYCTCKWFCGSIEWQNSPVE